VAMFYQPPQLAYAMMTCWTRWARARAPLVMLRAFGSELRQGAPTRAAAGGAAASASPRHAPSIFIQHFLLCLSCTKIYASSNDFVTVLHSTQIYMGTC
jgi:hypothetical protein